MNVSKWDQGHLVSDFCKASGGEGGEYYYGGEGGYYGGEGSVADFKYGYGLLAYRYTTQGEYYYHGEYSGEYGGEYGGSTSNVLEYGNWIGAQDKFISVAFNIAGQLHAGWIRISVDATDLSITVTDYAYKTVSCTPIVTGDTGSSSTVPEPDTLGMLALGAVGVSLLKRRQKKSQSSVARSRR